ncbi:bifunctional heptose 7-phosphate kinase/heptose 1-phosphate adenyltransferase [Longimicrobium sp.]|uniref:bifunctional heptose 7-phosphate kinase/heptose 1-phosphate adenyltransferase n=1 Tax=Longimicrobium sp. TaxID=2029185 RepID=UPI002E2F6A00|nr:PfkB family carbohydrate kinase [Longimicrobium sp.]HEX6041246.1 PfkB family carbohydrate kinase [Longimicrobium sp.]
MERLTRARLDEILERCRGLRVAVVGDLMLDVYLVGSVSRISPEAPVPVVHVAEERVALGGAANVAANVVALGADCELVGCVGADAAGLQIRGALTRLDGGTVHPRLVEFTDRPTTTKTRVVARHQQVVRFDRERDDDVAGDCEAELVRAVREAVAAADALVLEDYNKGVLVPSVIRAALEQAQAAGIPSVVDPKFRNFFAFGGATVFKPNAVELGTALGQPLRADDDAWLEEARGRVGARHLLLTLGEHGMALRSEDGQTLRVPTQAREVYDVSGAGDTVTAFLAVSLAAGASIQEAAVLANLAAGIEVGKPGVATVSPDEVRALLAESPHPLA